MTCVHLLLSSHALTSLGFNSNLLIFTFHNIETMSMGFLLYRLSLSLFGRELVLENKHH